MVMLHSDRRAVSGRCYPLGIDYEVRHNLYYRGITKVTKKIKGIRCLADILFKKIPLIKNEGIFLDSHKSRTINEMKYEVFHPNFCISTRDVFPSIY
jgi:hypothetical protein